jgi:hypothetical protein
VIRVACVLLLVASSASAEARAYRGAHPVDREGHWHEVEDVHVHDDLPVGLDPFGDVGGVLVFLGDPMLFGYQGDVYTYRGAHPIPHVEGYCAIAGDHRHTFAPEGAYRRGDDGAYQFSGAMRGGLAMVRPRRANQAPPGPIVARPLRPNQLPYYYGCPQQIVMGPSGPIAVPLPNCIPAVAVPQPAPTPPPAPVNTGPVTGAYTTVWPAPPPVQANPIPQPRVQSQRR